MVPYDVEEAMWCLCRESRPRPRRLPHPLLEWPRPVGGCTEEGWHRDTMRA